MPKQFHFQTSFYTPITTAFTFFWVLISPVLANTETGSHGVSNHSAEVSPADNPGTEKSESPPKKVKSHSKASSSAEHAGEPHWTYGGKTGPANWGKLKPDFAVCGTGKSQSPVNVLNPLEGKIEPIQFMYHPQKGTVENNGHTLQVNVSPGSSIRLQGERFELLQFHFHTPSEHAIQGKLSELEVHLVHKSAQGKLAVVGVMIHPGRNHEWIDTIWKHSPKEAGAKMEMKEVLINPYGLLPEDQEYFHYMGSLTTPPCSEGVYWNLMKNGISFSLEQIQFFKAFFQLNARPTQPLMGRKIVTH